MEEKEEGGKKVGLRFSFSFSSPLVACVLKTQPSTLSANLLNMKRSPLRRPFIH